MLSIVKGGGGVIVVVVVVWLHGWAARGGEAAFFRDECGDGTAWFGMMRRERIVHGTNVHVLIGIVGFG